MTQPGQPAAGGGNPKPVFTLVSEGTTQFQTVVTENQNSDKPSTTEAVTSKVTTLRPMFTLVPEKTTSQITPMNNVETSSQSQNLASVSSIQTNTKPTQQTPEPVYTIVPANLATEQSQVTENQLTYPLSTQPSTLIIPIPDSITYDAQTTAATTGQGSEESAEGNIPVTAADDTTTTTTAGVVTGSGPSIEIYTSHQPLEGVFSTKSSDDITTPEPIDVVTVQSVHSTPETTNEDGSKLYTTDRLHTADTSSEIMQTTEHEPDRTVNGSDSETHNPARHHTTEGDVLTNDIDDTTTPGGKSSLPTTTKITTSIYPTVRITTPGGGRMAIAFSYHDLQKNSTENSGGNDTEPVALSIQTNTTVLPNVTDNNNTESSVHTYETTFSQTEVPDQSYQDNDTISNPTTTQLDTNLGNMLQSDSRKHDTSNLLVELTTPSFGSTQEQQDIGNSLSKGISMSDSTTEENLHTGIVTLVVTSNYEDSTAENNQQTEMTTLIEGNGNSHIVDESVGDHTIQTPVKTSHSSSINNELALALLKNQKVSVSSTGLISLTTENPTIKGMHVSTTVSTTPDHTVAESMSTTVDYNSIDTITDRVLSQKQSMYPQYFSTSEPSTIAGGDTINPTSSFEEDQATSDHTSMKTRDEFSYNLGYNGITTSDIPSAKRSAAFSATAISQTMPYYQMDKIQPDSSPSINTGMLTTTSEKYGDISKKDITTENHRDNIQSTSNALENAQEFETIPDSATLDPSTSELTAMSAVQVHGQIGNETVLQNMADQTTTALITEQFETLYTDNNDDSTMSPTSTGAMATNPSLSDNFQNSRTSGPRTVAAVTVDTENTQEIATPAHADTGITHGFLSDHENVSSTQKLLRRVTQSKAPAPDDIRTYGSLTTFETPSEQGQTQGTIAYNSISSSSSDVMVDTVFTAGPHSNFQLPEEVSTTESLGQTKHGSTSVDLLSNTTPNNIAGTVELSLLVNNNSAIVTTDSDIGKMVTNEEVTDGQWSSKETLISEGTMDTTESFREIHKVTSDSDIQEGLTAVEVTGQEETTSEGPKETNDEAEGTKQATESGKKMHNSASDFESDAGVTTDDVAMINEMTTEGSKMNNEGAQEKWVSKWTDSVGTELTTAKVREIHSITAGSENYKGFTTHEVAEPDKITAKSFRLTGDAVQEQWRSKRTMLTSEGIQFTTEKVPEIQRLTLDSHTYTGITTEEIEGLSKITTEGPEVTGEGVRKQLLSTATPISEGTMHTKENFGEVHKATSDSDYYVGVTTVEEEGLEKLTTHDSLVTNDGAPKQWPSTGISGSEVVMYTTESGTYSHTMTSDFENYASLTTERLSGFDKMTTKGSDKVLDDEQAIEANTSQQPSMFSTEDNYGLPFETVTALYETTEGNASKGWISGGQIRDKGSTTGLTSAYETGELDLVSPTKTLEYDSSTIHPTDMGEDKTTLESAEVMTSPTTDIRHYTVDFRSTNIPLETTDAGRLVIDKHTMDDLITTELPFNTSETTIQADQKGSTKSFERATEYYKPETKSPESHKHSTTGYDNQEWQETFDITVKTADGVYYQCTRDDSTIAAATYFVIAKGTSTEC